MVKWLELEPVMLRLSSRTPVVAERPSSWPPPALTDQTIPPATVGGWVATSLVLYQSGEKSSPLAAIWTAASPSLQPTNTTLAA